MKLLSSHDGKKGASSVLVILMMVVLALFGLSALTASLASVRLTEKSGEWSEEFYILEAKAEKMTAGIDSILHEAELKAVEYMKDSMFLYESGTILDEGLQKLVSLNVTEYLPKAAREDYLTRVMEAVYIAHAIKGLELAFEDMGIEYPAGLERHIIEDEAVSGIFMMFDVSEEEGTKNISVGIEVKFPGYLLEYDEGTVSGTRITGTGRYNVVEWREWQESFEYGEDIQYAEPVREN